MRKARATAYMRMVRRALALALTAAFASGAMAQGIAFLKSQLALTSATTAYSAGQLIASSATAASIAVPSFIPQSNTKNQPGFPRVRLSTNDSTSTAWGGVTIQVDFWSTAPTFNNGDRGAWSVKTGTANHLGAFTCVMSAEQTDGAYAECAPTVNNLVTPNVAANTPIFWTLEAITPSGVTGASKIFTLAPEWLN